MKKLLILIVLVALAGGGFYFWKQWERRATTERTPNRPTTARVEARDIRFAINAAGEIGPAEQVSVRPEVNGRIAELTVDLGDTVRRGDLLCRLDDEDLQIERSSRQTEIEGARLQVEKAQRNIERATQLHANNLISLELFEDTKTEYELATNQLQRADQALRLVEDRLSKTRIMAPFDCTVLTRPVSVGQAVSGSGGFNAGTEIMTIANLSDMVIQAHVNQADVPRLSIDQQVEIQIESVPGLTLAGVIERIAPQATIKNNIKGFAVRILLSKVDPRVRPGMTANVKIPVASAEDVLAVPLAAVFTESSQETQRIERYVYVKNGEQFERRPVTIGVSDFFFAEVRDGLSAGDVVSLVEPSVEKPRGIRN